MTSLASSLSKVPWTDHCSCSSKNFIGRNSSIDRMCSSKTELIHCSISRSHFNVIGANNHSQIIQEQSSVWNKRIGFWLLINSMSLLDPTSVKNEWNVSRKERRTKYARSCIQTLNFARTQERRQGAKHYLYFPSSGKSNKYSKVNQSLCSPEQALKVPGGLGSRISRQSVHEGGRVNSPKHRPLLPPRK